jgi:hypothetical protein
MFIVKYCVRDYGDVWKTEVASFETEEEAQDYVDNEESSYMWSNEWFIVEEEET